VSQSLVDRGNIFLIATHPIQSLGNDHSETPRVMGSSVIMPAWSLTLWGAAVSYNSEQLGRRVWMAVRRDGYCGAAAGAAAGLSELGFTDRMKAMILQRSSLVLIIPPKGGIGPVTISCFTRA
jgi:hypothetical protein